MNFESSKGEVKRMLIPARSLYFMSGSSRYKWSFFFLYFINFIQLYFFFISFFIEINRSKIINYKQIIKKK